jgi:hypothetical protein
VDGLWVDAGLWFGVSARAVHQLNISSNPHVVVHIEDGLAPFIVEGVVRYVVSSRAQAAGLAELSSKKYGYTPSLEAYLVGVWHVPAIRVLTWSDFSKDATRFVFSSPE